MVSFVLASSKIGTMDLSLNETTSVATTTFQIEIAVATVSHAVVAKVVANAKRRPSLVGTMAAVAPKVSTIVVGLVTIN